MDNKRPQPQPQQLSLAKSARQHCSEWFVCLLIFKELFVFKLSYTVTCDLFVISVEGLFVFLLFLFESSSFMYILLFLMKLHGLKTIQCPSSCDHVLVIASQ